MSKTIHCLMSLVIVPVMALAQGTGGEGSGTVKDSSGGVVIGAQVSLRTASGEVQKTVTTDARGRYVLPGIAAGTYTLSATKDGFSPLSQEIVVGTGPVTRDFTMSPAGFAEEVTVSFTSEQSRTALKMEAAVRDIPMTVKTYTSSFVKALDAKDASALYSYMNGINRTGEGAIDASIRGFNPVPESYNFLVNGMPGFSARRSSQNLANIERVEILKGPASVLYGRAAPGGVVNFVTKRPLFEAQRLLDLRTGTFTGKGPGFGDANSYRLGADFTGPFGATRRFLYRFIAAYDKADSFRDFADKKEDIFLAPSVTWNISGGTVLTAEGEYRRIRGPWDVGLIAPQNNIALVAPLTTAYQEPGDYENDTGGGFAAHLTKAFAAGWNLNTSWRSVTSSEDRSGLENNRAESDNRTVRRRDRHQVNDRAFHFLDSTLAKTLKAGPVVHNMLAGLTGGYQLQELDRRRFGNLGFFVNLLQPVQGLYARPANPNPGFQRSFRSWEYSAYLQDRIDLGSQWKGLLALRYDGRKTHFEQARPAGLAPGSIREGAWVPTVGVVFQPDSRWSLFGNYASSFEPNMDLQAANPLDTGRFKPTTGRQFEGGVKAEFANGRADATTSFFHITKNNVVVPISPDVNEQIGEERSQGLEFDLRLWPSDHFQAIFGYAYTDAKITEDTRPERLGALLVNTAKHAFNLWCRYDIASGRAQGLGLGVGIIWRDDRAGSIPAQVTTQGTFSVNVLELPRYFRADAGLYFVRKRYELTLRLSNAFDEFYFESSNGVVQVRPGRPRELGLSLRVRL